MNKQRMSNILSSIQMNSRDRKDFIDELSKLGQGGQGGGEVSGECHVRIIELTKEELMTGKELDITGEEYLKHYTIFISKVANITLIFNYECSYFETDMGASHNYDVYCNKSRSDYLEVNYCFTVHYSNLKDKITLGVLSPINYKGDINFILSQNLELNVAIVSECNPNISYSAILYKNGYNILGTYYNGTFTAFAEGKIQIYNVNSETGEITLSKSIDLLTLADKIASL